MLVDGRTNSFSQGTWLLYESKTADFNALFPAISVVLSHVLCEDMMTHAEADLQHGTNQYHAYLGPLLNTNSGTSRLSDALMDMSVFTVDNVNHIQWNIIGRFFRSLAALCESKVLALLLSGDFISFYYHRDLFEAYGLAWPRTLEEYVFASKAFKSTDLNGDGQPDDGSCFPHAGEFASEKFFIWITQVHHRGTSQGSLVDTQKPVASTRESCSPGGNLTVEGSGWSTRNDKRHHGFGNVQLLLL